MSVDIVQMEGLQQPTPESMQSLLFELECPASSVPVATMLAPSSPNPTKSSTLGVHSISPYMQRLREIEATANLAILRWNTGGAESSVPAKRKSLYGLLAVRIALTFVSLRRVV
jgi:hypothetical protein